MISPLVCSSSAEVRFSERALRMRGNDDRELVARARGEQIDVPDEVTRRAQRKWRNHVKLSGAVPHPSRSTASVGAVLPWHTWDDEGVIPVDTRLERWHEAVAELSAEVTTVMCGHANTPFVRLVDRRPLVNAGSIGMPYGRSGGCGALLQDGAVTLTIDARVETLLRSLRQGGTR